MFLRYKVQQIKLFVIKGHFLPIYPLTTQNIKNLMHDACNFYFSVCDIFCPFTPLTTWKINIFQKWKTTWRYYFTHMYQKLWSHDVWFRDMVRDKQMNRWRDGQTHGQKKWHIEMGAPPKKFFTCASYDTFWEVIVL